MTKTSSNVKPLYYKAWIEFFLHDKQQNNKVGIWAYSNIHAVSDVVEVISLLYHFSDKQIFFTSFDALKMSNE